MSNSVADLNFTALTDPVEASAVRTFRKSARANKSPAFPSAVTNDISSVGFLVVVGVMAVGFSIALVWTFAGHVNDDDVTVANALILVLPALLLSGYWILLRRTVSGLRDDRWLRWYRMASFAEANDLEFSALSAPPDYPGMIFHLGAASSVLDRLSTKSGRTIDMGDFTCTTGTGKSGLSFEWGYLAVKLDGVLPNVLLEPKVGRRSFPDSVDRSQSISLEGDFDRYFTLYCPRHREVDALSVITPDLMALLIDQAAHFEVEIVDSWLFVYADSPLNFSDVATVRHMFRIADTVGAKAVRRSKTFDLTDHAAAVRSSQRRLWHGPIRAGVVTMGVIGLVYLVVAVVGPLLRQ